MYNIGKLGIIEQRIGDNCDGEKVSHNYLGDKGINEGIGGENKKGNKGKSEGKSKGITRKNWDGNEPSIECRYKGERRPVHPAVCEWHRMEMDEVCRESECPRMSLGWGKEGS